MANDNGKRFVVAIDGPSGAGKSTVARGVAEALGYMVLDTGAMYRAVAFSAKKRGIATASINELTEMAASLDIRFVGDPQTPRLMVDGCDITDFIRTPEIGNLASAISAFEGVRKVLVEQQRRIGASGGIVTEGRDQTTVVFPDAKVKVFLDASAEERARRRYEELVEKGQDITYEDILAQQIERDERDSTRTHSPLRVAEGAVVIDSDKLSAEQVIERILELCK
ncbi:MAG: (d)CMP kinase [bacterium]